MKIKESNIRQEAKEIRLKLANELIEVIKSNGRKFFENKHGHECRLIISNINGQIYFVEDYTGAKICVKGEYIKSRKFCHGSGLNNFIVSLVKFVRTGRKVRVDWLGQHWGYGVGIVEVRMKAIEIGYVNDHMTKGKLI